MSAARTLLSILSLLAYFLATHAGAVAATSVIARASSTQLGANETFELAVDITGEDDVVPDLSVLQQDFQILGRRQSTNVRVINGRMRRSTRLVLTLRPNRDGKILVPPIPAGAHQSEPIEIEVIGNNSGMPREITPRLPAKPQAWSKTAPHQGSMPSPPRRKDKYVSSPETGGEFSRAQDKPKFDTERSQTSGFNIWFWIALFLASGWITSFIVWRASNRAGGPNAAQTDHNAAAVVEKTQPKPEPTEIERASEAVKEAYLKRDAANAKQALLQWGKHRWPNDPPINLSSLAQRCPPEAQQGILELDRALYSPLPESWYERHIWEDLV